MGRAGTWALSALDYWRSKQFNSANLIFERATFPPYNNIELSTLPNDSCLDIRKSKQTTCTFRDIVLSPTQQEAILTFIFLFFFFFFFFFFLQKKKKKKKKKS